MAYYGRYEEYRYLATSVEGFVQQLAVSYLKNCYWFYVRGEIPPEKDAGLVDEKLLTRYGVTGSKWAKARASKRGEAKLQYLRYRETFLLLATAGRHPFFDGERAQIRDAREVPIRFYGYSVSYKAGHPHVRIAEAQYKVLVEVFSEKALSSPPEALAAQLYALPFEPYAPVKRQLRRLLAKVNRLRRTAGLERIPLTCLRQLRKTVRPFDYPPESRGV